MKVFLCELNWYDGNEHVSSITKVFSTYYKASAFANSHPEVDEMGCAKYETITEVEVDGE